MTHSEIQFNYDQAVRQASILDSASGKLEQLASSQMESAIGTLKNAWQSDNSSQYYQKAGKVREDMRTTAKKIREIAQAIRATAETIRQAELRALEIAKTRTYRSYR